MLKGTSTGYMILSGTEKKASGRNLQEPAYQRTRESRSNKICFPRNSIDELLRYTYEVCFFDGAQQKPNKGGMNFGLGLVSVYTRHGLSNLVLALGNSLHGTTLLVSRSVRLSTTLSSSTKEGRAAGMDQNAVSLYVKYSILVCSDIF